MTAVATIFFLAGQPGPAWVVVVIEFLTVLSRIVVGFHWPGDILGGIVVGIVTGLLAWSLRRSLERWIIKPLVRLANKLGL
jgi:membrane-associated phospholipid phosphatase